MLLRIGWPTPLLTGLATFRFPGRMDPEPSSAEESPTAATSPNGSSRRGVLARLRSSVQARCPHSTDCSGADDLGERALRSLKAGRHDDAVNSFSAALSGTLSPAKKQQLLCGRSEAYARLSEQLLARPAQLSEERAINALDPTQYAQLALQDAEAAAAVDPNTAVVHQLQGAAHLLLEQYAAAREAYLRALFYEPGSAEVRQGLQEADAALMQAGARRCRRRVEGGDDELECILCLKLLYEPVTTPCGHTFCKPCFARSADHGNKCPMCRTVLHVGNELPVTVVLKNFLERNFPDDYAARRAEEAAEAAASTSGSSVESPLPLFVMSVLLPGEHMALQIFEPRYRLMVRRCMQGNRRFGMAVRLRGSDDVEPVATEVEITECRPMPDGRFYLEVTGRRRCRLQRTWEQDGYRMASPQYFRDDVASEDTRQQSQALVQEVDGMADRWAAHLREVAGRRPVPQVLELLQRAGDKPAGATDLEALGFWALCMLPMDDGSRLDMLSTTCSLTRLRAVREMLAHVCDKGMPGSCAIM